MRIKFLVSVLILILPAIVHAQEGNKNFTLEECIDYALKNNADVKTKELDLEIAREQVDQTVATGLPQITGTVDMAYNYQVATQFLPDFISPAVYGVLFQEELLEPRDMGAMGILPAQFGTKYSGSAVLSLRQMIFNGSYFVGLRAAKTFTDFSRKELEKQKIDMVESVSKAYYGALISREQVALINANYARLDTLLKNTTALYENGFAEKIDVSRIKIQFNNIMVEKKYAEELYQINKHILKVLMGMPVDQELHLSESISEIEFEAVEIVPEEQFTYNQRIDYNLLQTNEELVELDIKNVQAQYMPQLNLYGTYGASTGRQEFNQIFEEEWFGLGAVGVTLNLSIFDGFLKKNIVQEKRIQKAQIVVAKDNLKNAIDLQIEQAEVRYNRSIDYMAAQYENMTLAEEVYYVAKTKYEEGVGSNIEVTEADNALKTAQNNYYNALYDALVAKIDLKKAYGNLDIK
ncbi:MAG: TolC family protein [Candidatus Cyclobacteriaceae bacterium M2_1C_046]